ncbi:MAG: hypothetical protein KGL53_09625, partial [Elusimicrobia bacterium]|nr:hypothetical protein [Elusimicrobiota bacterium]
AGASAAAAGTVLAASLLIVGAAEALPAALSGTFRALMPAIAAPTLSEVGEFASLLGVLMTTAMTASYGLEGAVAGAMTAPFAVLGAAVGCASAALVLVLASRGLIVPGWANTLLASAYLLAVPAGAVWALVGSAQQPRGRGSAWRPLWGAVWRPALAAGMVTTVLLPIFGLLHLLRP